MVGAAWAGASAAFPVAILALAAVAALVLQLGPDHRGARPWRPTSPIGTLTSDNSLHQVETDLREILAELARVQRANDGRARGARQDRPKTRREQLKDVIRYFKNLFTQAPALFFFLTDKEYFDGDGQQDRGRPREGVLCSRAHLLHPARLRRAAVLEECLEYFGEVMPGAGPARSARSARPRDDRVGRGRRHVAPRSGSCAGSCSTRRTICSICKSADAPLRAGGARMAARLEFDERAVSSPGGGDRRVVQFLLEQKVPAYRFGGGRDYGEREACATAWRACSPTSAATASTWIASLYPDAGGSEIRPHGAPPDHRGGRLAAAGSWTAAVRSTATVRRSAGVRTPPRTSRPSRSWSRRTSAPSNGSWSARLRIAHDLEVNNTTLSADLKQLRGADAPTPAEQTDRLAADVSRQLSPIIAAARSQHQDAISSAGWKFGTVGANVLTINGERMLVVYGTEPENQRVAASFLASVRPGPVPVLLIDDDPVPDPAIAEDWRAALAEFDPLVTLVSLADETARASEMS